MPDRRYRIVDAAVRAAAVERVLAMVAPNGTMSRSAASKAVADDLGVHPNSVLNWVNAVLRTSTTLNPIELAAENAQLKQKLEASQRINRGLVERLHIDPRPEATG